MKPKMKTWHVYGRVVGTKYFGTVEAKTLKDAEDQAYMDLDLYASLCHQCSKECEDPQVEDLIVEEGEAS